MSIDDYVVLWSPHQRAFHVETVGEMLQRNRDIFAREAKGDYIVLGFEHTHEAATESRRKLQRIRDKDTGADDDDT